MSVFADAAAHFQGTYQASEQPAATVNHFVMATSKAMDLLEGHSLRTAIQTAVIAGSIGKLMRLPERTVHSTVYAALLHDVGLAKVVADVYPHLPPGMNEKQLFQIHALTNARVIGIPQDRVFSTDLLQLLSQHPLAARDLLAEFHLSEDVIEIVAAHHELCDGSGYPFGLTREQIPMGARILTFADVVTGVMNEVSGLTTRRQALENFLDFKIQDKFDPDVVTAFVSLIEDHEDFLKQLSTLEAETWVHMLLPERQSAINGRMLLDIVQAMGRLSDRMMPLYKEGRSHHVASMAIALAQALGIHREQCGELAAAAMLMDIGHLATPLKLLLKTGPLLAEERAIIQDHPLLAQEILKGIPGFENIVQWISEHHERMNGKGYPGQKKGFEISVGGRILALSDVYDALISPRPYRANAYEPLDALPIIGQGRITQFDNQLVTILRQVVLDVEILVPLQ